MPSHLMHELEVTKYRDTQALKVEVHQKHWSTGPRDTKRCERCLVQSLKILQSVIEWMERGTLLHGALCKKDLLIFLSWLLARSH